MAEVLYGKSNIGPGGPGRVQHKVYLDDIDMIPSGVIVTGLTDPSAGTVQDTFAFQVTKLQQGAFQLNIIRVDSNDPWQQDLSISYLAWVDK